MLIDRQKRTYDRLERERINERKKTHVKSPWTNKTMGKLIGRSIKSFNKLVMD